MRLVLLLTVIESALIAVFLVWLRYRRASTPAQVTNHPLETSAVSAPHANTVDASHDARWRFINSWRVEPQFNDRMQAIGAVGLSTETAGGRRSSTRRRHQLSNKQWSRERHD